MVIISTGIPLSLYYNTYVRTWITSLNLRHRPIYWLKLAQLISCVIYITQQELSTLMCCLFYISFIIFSHMPFFDIYYLLLHNCSLSAASLLFPQSLIFGCTLFGDYYFGGLFPTSCQIITNLRRAYGYLSLITRRER